MKKNNRNWKILESLKRREPSQVRDEFHQIFEQEPTHSIETICNAAVEEINNCLSPCPQPSFSRLTTTLENDSLSVFDELGPSPTKLLTLENVSLIDLNDDLYLSHSSNGGEPAPDECILSSSDFSISETRNNVQINDIMTQNIPHSSNTLDTNIETNTTDIAGVQSVIPGLQNRKRQRRGQAEPEKWKKNLRKNRRQKGEPYLSSKGVLKPGKLLGESKCMGTCREKYGENTCLIIKSLKIPGSSYEIILNHFPECQHTIPEKIQKKSS
ncbi:uncharacterized protein LOC125068324 [Vanessa atalanta]|uniref:uncharacterized protein LOC125068324 n=2 Tax=Vanessa atalanta TaxID=42275 RepID=UPI001FCCFDC0|nr:uncharacterized protein LOC125068324 [Vanessa atalanta]